MKDLKKILYAEDEPDVQIVVETVVQSLSDYQIKICDNGKKLIECVEDYNPDLILLDVMMPEMDGPTTLKAIQSNEKTKNIPVIFMTAKAQIHEIKDLQKANVVGIITKPFDPMKLCSELQEIWENTNKSE